VPKQADALSWTGVGKRYHAYGVARADGKHISLSALSLEQAVEALIVLHAIEVTLNKSHYMLESAGTQKHVILSAQVCQLQVTQACQ